MVRLHAGASAASPLRSMPTAMGNGLDETRWSVSATSAQGLGVCRRPAPRRLRKRCTLGAVQYRARRLRWRRGAHACGHRFAVYFCASMMASRSISALNSTLEMQYGHGVQPSVGARATALFESSRQGGQKECRRIDTRALSMPPAMSVRVSECMRASVLFSCVDDGITESCWTSQDRQAMHVDMYEHAYSHPSGMRSASSTCQTVLFERVKLPYRQTRTGTSHARSALPMCAVTRGLVPRRWQRGRWTRNWLGSRDVAQTCAETCAQASAGP